MEASWGQYTAKQIEDFEVVLLNTLGWDVNLPTCHEVTKHLMQAFETASAKNHVPEATSINQTAEIASMLAEPTVTSKVTVFNQIVILDYKMARYGSFVLG